MKYMNMYYRNKPLTVVEAVQMQRTFLLGKLALYNALDSVITNDLLNCTTDDEVSDSITTWLKKHNKIYNQAFGENFETGWMCAVDEVLDTQKNRLLRGSGEVELTRLENTRLGGK